MVSTTRAARASAASDTGSAESATSSGQADAAAPIRARASASRRSERPASPIWGAPNFPDSPSIRMDNLGKAKFLSRPKKSFSPEFKDEAVKMVIETSRPIARVAKELGINEGTLGNWVGIYRREHAGEEPPLTVSERARLRELERETRELKMELEFMKKAAAYFARDHR